MSTDLTPVLSRRQVNPSMAARGMRSAAELAASKPCGTRVRYYAGCRCDACRAANSAYENQRAEARARGEGNGIVSAEPARLHLAWLSSQGVGRKTAADAAKVACSIVSKIIDRHRLKIRAQTEKRILAVTQAAAADRAYIDGTPTWERLVELLACGYPKARIGSEIIGHRVHGLQIKQGRVTARNAERVRQAYERLLLAPLSDTKRALDTISELRAEGFRPDRILRELCAEAVRRGWPEPSIAPPAKGKLAGRLRAQEVELIAAVHALLTGEA
jgi:hypothetical protein